MNPEQPASSSEKPKKEYELIVNKLMADIESVPDDEAMRRRVAVDDFLNDVLDRAASGEITGSRGNVYDREAMLSQFSLYDRQLKEYAPDPEVTIPSFNGLRDAFRALASNEATGGYFADSLDEIVHGDWRERQLKRRAGKGVDNVEPTERIAHVEREPMSKDSVDKVGGAVLDAVGVVPVERASETDLETNERFLRETREELRSLYAQHRGLDPHSYEAQSLVNQIKNAKEDAGRFAKRITQLKGNDIWS